MIFLEPLQNFFVQNFYVSAETHAFNLFMYKKEDPTKNIQWIFFKTF